MKKYYIYREENTDPKTGKPYATRRYYEGKLKKVPERCKFVGTAELSDDYFIVGSETHHAAITDLDDIILQYSATLKNGDIAMFRHSVQEMLRRAKQGIMPYISFAGHKVQKPIVQVNGKLNPVLNKLDIES